MADIQNPYSICVIDIGSPKLGNLGWSIYNIKSHEEYTGQDLDELIPLIIDISQKTALIIGLEAPLFVPLRQDLKISLKARKGEGRRPWSAGAGAQVLAMNLPIMTYLFSKLYKQLPNLDFHLTEDSFEAKALNILVFEALVSGSDKGSSHINDAQIMVNSCLQYSQALSLPKSILEDEENTKYLNITASSLLHCGYLKDLSSLHLASPIYKPDKTI